MGWKILVVLFMLSVSLVSGELFFFYDADAYTVKKIFNPYLHEAVFSPLYGLQLDAAGNEENAQKEIVEIIITEKGFKPEKVEVKVNQTVVWKNEREKLPVLIMGMREISGMKQHIKLSDSFNYSFSKPGKYFYVDGIILGYKGEIVVVR